MLAVKLEVQPGDQGSLESSAGTPPPTLPVPEGMAPPVAMLLINCSTLATPYSHLLCLYMPLDQESNSLGCLSWI